MGVFHVFQIAQMVLNRVKDITIECRNDPNISLVVFRELPLAKMARGIEY